MGIETVTTAADALTYISSHSGITTAQLQQLALQMRADVPNAQSVLLYSGNLQTVPGAPDVPFFKIAEFMGANSPTGAKVATIGQTDAGKLLDSGQYQTALENAIAKDLNKPVSDSAVINKLNEILYGTTAPDGTRTTPGLWDTASERFIDANVKAGMAVNTLTGPEGIELNLVKKLLESDASTIDGIPLR